MKCACCNEELEEAYGHCSKCMCGQFELLINPETNKTVVQCYSCKKIIGRLEKDKSSSYFVTAYQLWKENGNAND